MFFTLPSASRVVPTLGGTIRTEPPHTHTHTRSHSVAEVTSSAPDALVAKEELPPNYTEALTLRSYPPLFKCCSRTINARGGST